MRDLYGALGAMIQKGSYFGTSRSEGLLGLDGHRLLRHESYLLVDPSGASERPAAS
jgi:hypothetical protein